MHRQGSAQAPPQRVHSFQNGQHLTLIKPEKPENTGRKGSHATGHGASRSGHHPRHLSPGPAGVVPFSPASFAPRVRRSRPAQRTALPAPATLICVSCFIPRLLALPSLAGAAASLHFAGPRCGGAHLSNIRRADPWHPVNDHDAMRIENVRSGRGRRLSWPRLGPSYVRNLPCASLRVRVPVGLFPLQFRNGN